jgi:hypothetical protein
MASLLRRACGWVTLVTFSSVFALPFTAGSHLLIDDDPGCGDEALVSLHPFTQFESVSPPLVPEHCALCHWLRTLSGAQVSAVVSVALPVDLHAAVSLLKSSRARSHVAGRSSRGPPLFPLT